MVCKGCQSTRYCSREHQKQDWEQHRLQCGHPFEVRTNPTLGRHLVATRHIAEGEVVFKEEPLVFGPDSGDSRVLSGDSFTLACTSCCRVLDPNPSVWVRCSRCEWPMCSAACQDAPVHLPECWVFMERRVQPAPITVHNVIASSGLVSKMIFIVRCLLANEKRASKIRQLQGHSADSLKMSSLDRELRESVAALALNALGPSKTDAYDIMRLQAVVDTNRFQMSSGRANVRSCALFYHASFMSHSCVPNVEWGLSDVKSMELIVRAMRNIDPGDVITTMYVPLDGSTFERKSTLLRDKGFECSCERCMDPTEFGSFISSICCEECRRKGRLGLLTGVQVLSGSADWRCHLCKATVLVEEVYRYLDRAEKLKLGNGLENEKLIDILQFPHGRLHPRNSLMLKCSSEIVSKIMSDLRRGGRGIEILGFTPSSHDLQQVLSLCRVLLEGYDKIIPALSQRTGTVLLDRHTAMAELLRRRMHYYVSYRAGGNEGATEIAVSAIGSSRCFMSVLQYVRQKDLVSAELELKKAENVLKLLADYREELKKLRLDMFVLERVWGWTSAALQFCAH